MDSSLSRRQIFLKYRRQFNVTQRQLSIDMNVSESHIRNIESGRGNPDAKLLFKLAKYFETTPENLFPDLADVEICRSVLH
ncbi:anaerobic benzoate catabolism transcriptional regulator [Paenibacillus larvae subsp. larvae]|uniref:Anaerobic benzoate catabolism transcriptional regulator n=1 Tax=Paenibacillus larvae subsp. larvae TaxID=147375 RepID=A0A2L1UHT3_9BACL|nr:helix-turn-helix transcriptional regulator [Paenibacillus larvae]AQT84319.1 transcriptional regulator [Paenibacillus larvae subsp. pulvifaciens]AQZ46301.1 transcriptional regulator [Paenibacillus larvae subsp. pulvifaciens]AVF27981.1 anaerobic benzoate catabolism transcriptional regulator [Paenibacillus larvae subsp. larvae]AVF32483.1 anaerobic benzoate catabolism transcriptional regulator [Paenibacillus larvae subsp. larvae]MBH0344062.1 XRE family transcriptional regulator [Paenibacillus l